MDGGRRMRRFGAGSRILRRHDRGVLLPQVRAASPGVRAHSLSNAFSCWYCDLKVHSMNEPLFNFGRKHSRFSRVWFSIGVGFSLAALVGVALILLWELARTIRIGGKMAVIDLLFGTSAVLNWNMSLADAGYVFISTLISVFVHEIGHAIAAASEGVKAEYFAIFIAVLFPGALVAFDNELLQEIPHFSSLRIYCAGIWHNAVSSAICGMILLLLPWILSPIYVHGQNPLVLGVPSSSPLYGYLSPGDVIISLDGIPIHDPQEWVDVSFMVQELVVGNTNYSEHDVGNTVGYRVKGFCVPNALIRENEETRLVGNLSSCPPNLSGFFTIPCASISVLDGHLADYEYRKGPEHCLNSQEVVGFKRCGGRWLKAAIDDDGCICSKDEACLAPFQTSTSIWIEITYYKPSTLPCPESKEKLIGESWSFQANNSSCIRSFIYISDVDSLVDSVWLTGYQPRQAIGWTYLPYILERVLKSTYQISLVLAIINSLPVYFLDGECILEALCKIGLPNPRKRRRLLQLILIPGTFLSILSVLRFIAHLTFI